MTCRIILVCCLSIAGYETSIERDATYEQVKDPSIWTCSGATRHVTSVRSRVRCGAICLESLDCVMFTYGSDVCVLFVAGMSNSANITSEIYDNMTWFIIK